MANLRTGLYGSYYGSYFNESEPLTESEMKENAYYIRDSLISKGWTLNAIAGMLGNIQAESTLNPGRWQSENVGNTSGGYGLVQWTPATKFLNWCDENYFIDPSEMDANLDKIVNEVANNQQWIATDGYNFSFREFTYSTDSVSNLAKAFLLNYERPADQSVEVQNYRAELGLKWYSIISGGSEIVVPDSIIKSKKFNFLLFNVRKRRNLWIKQNSIIK